MARPGGVETGRRCNDAPTGAKKSQAAVVARMASM